MTQKQKITWKSIFDLKYVTFSLAILAFILFLLAILVIGFDNKIGGEIITLKTLHQWIRSAGGELNKAWINSYNLMVYGIGISGIGIILLFFNLLPIKKWEKVHPWFYWSGIFFELTAMILVIAGESLFVADIVSSTTNPDLKFSDFFGVPRFVGMILCSTVLPLALLIYALTIQFKQSKNKTNLKTKK